MFRSKSRYCVIVCTTAYYLCVQLFPVFSALTVLSMHLPAIQNGWVNCMFLDPLEEGKVHFSLSGSVMRFFGNFFFINRTHLVP